MNRPLIIANEIQRTAAVNFIANLSLADGKAWTVKVERLKKKRTLSQNALLHKWLQIIAEDTGNSIEGVKEAYRTMFLGKDIVTLGSDSFETRRSTTKLSTQEFSDFCDQVHAHATQDLGILLPIPDEQHYDRDGRAA